MQPCRLQTLCGAHCWKNVAYQCLLYMHCHFRFSFLKWKLGRGLLMQILFGVHIGQRWGCGPCAEPKNILMAHTHTHTRARPHTLNRYHFLHPSLSSSVKSCIKMFLWTHISNNPKGALIPNTIFSTKKSIKCTVKKRNFQIIRSSTHLRKAQKHDKTSHSQPESTYNHTHTHPTKKANKQTKWTVFL